jgi:small subunit ribosomal protein S2
VDVLVPGNDDALRAIRLFAGRVADAIIAGRSFREARGIDPAAAQKGAAEGDRRARPPRAVAAHAAPPSTPTA